MIDLVIPGFRALPPARRAPRPGVRPHHRRRLPQHDLPDAVPRARATTRWLVHEADMAPAYRWHRRFLQHLQSRHPGERWVLKSPGHLWCLDALLAEYPDAVLVQTHRDPLKVIASVARAGRAAAPRGQRRSRHRRGAEEFAELLLPRPRPIRGRSATTARPAVAGRRRAVRRLHGRPVRHDRCRLRPAGLELSRRGRGAHADVPRRAPGRVRRRTATRWADTGLDADALRERARPYQERFDVPTEPVR